MTELAQVLSAATNGLIVISVRTLVIRGWRRPIYAPAFAIQSSPHFQLRDVNTHDPRQLSLCVCVCVCALAESS